MRALLQASKFADSQWKSYCVETARATQLEIISIDDQAYSAYRKSFVLRSQGQEEEAQRVVEEILKALPPCSRMQPRLNAIYGLLLSSKSWTYIAQLEFKKAIAVCSSWTNGISLYEMVAYRKLLTVRGVASRHMGRLDNAIQDLKAVFDAADKTRARLYVLANLCDTYCERGQSDVAHSMLSQSMSTQKMSFQDTYHRTMLLSFAEVCSSLGRYEESDGILLQLKDHFETGQCTERNDRQRHIRALLLLAQNQHCQALTPAAWYRTRDLWYDAISHTKKYQVISTSGWDYAIMCLSLHHASRTVSEIEYYDRWLQLATDIFLSGSEDHFWMRCLATKWVPYILKQDLGLSDHLHSRIRTCANLVQMSLRSLIE